MQKFHFSTLPLCKKGIFALLKSLGQRCKNFISALFLYAKKEFLRSSCMQKRNFCAPPVCKKGIFALLLYAKKEFLHSSCRKGKPSVVF